MATVVQTTANTASGASYSTALNKTFYPKKTLERAKAVLVYQKFGQKKPIPRNGGKTVEFRKWTLFTPDTTTQKLDEGVTPDGQNLGQTTVSATIDQYGAYVIVSDVLDMTAVDPVVSDCADLLGEQIGTVVDMATRNAMIADASDQFANGAANMKSIAASDYLTVAEIRKAVRTLKKNKARMFTDGRSPHYVCVVDPDAIYDLQSDSLWQDVSKYSNAEQIYSGEIGRLFGVVFVETSEGMISKQSVLNAVNANTSSSAEFVLKNDPTAAAVAYLSKGGNKIKIGTTEYTLASSGSYTAATKTVKLSAAASLSADAIVYSEDAGAPDASTKAAPDIHHSLIFGADSYGVIDIENGGNVEIIIKEAGSAGTADPLDQRSSVGAKIKAYVAKVLNSVWIIDMKHAVHS